MKNLIQKKYLFITIAIVILISGICFGYSKYNEKKYLKNLKEVVTLITDDAILSESITSLFETVWNKAVFDKYKYDYRSPYWGKEFNEALSIAMSDSSTVESVKVLNNKTTDIELKMKELNNPPSRFKTIYQNLIELYAATKEYSKLANSPEGSLESFRIKRNDLSSIISNNLEKLKIQIE
jgi:hypothetical protein